MPAGFNANHTYLSREGKPTVMIQAMYLLFRVGLALRHVHISHRFLTRHTKSCKRLTVLCSHKLKLPASDFWAFLCVKSLLQSFGVLLSWVGGESLALTGAVPVLPELQVKLIIQQQSVKNEEKSGLTAAVLSDG